MFGFFFILFVQSIFYFTNSRIDSDLKEAIYFYINEEEKKQRTHPDRRPKSNVNFEARDRHDTDICLMMLLSAKFDAKQKSLSIHKIIEIHEQMELICCYCVSGKTSACPPPPEVTAGLVSPNKRRRLPLTPDKSSLASVPPRLSRSA